MPRSPTPPALPAPSILFVLAVPRFPLPAKSLNDLFQLPSMHQGHEASIPHTQEPPPPCACSGLDLGLWRGPGCPLGSQPADEA